MSDQKVESGSTGAGNQGTPKPEFQASGSDQPTSQPQGQALTDQVKQALKDLGYDDIDTRIERGIQSTKDRRFADQDRLKGQVDELSTTLSRFQELTKLGVSPQDAEWRMRMEQFMEQQGQSPAGPADQPRFGKRDDWWVEAQRGLLKSAGVPENDPAVTEFARSKRFTSPEQYLTELTAFVGQRLSGSQTGGALNMGGGSATPLGADQSAQMRTQYLADLAKIPRGRILEITNLKRDYRSKGYDPDADQELQKQR